MEKELAIILGKMCEIAGHDFRKIDFTKQGWFFEYTWNAKQEKEFIEWLKKRIERSRKTREFFQIRILGGKDTAIGTASKFNLAYGFKTV